MTNWKTCCSIIAGLLLTVGAGCASSPDIPEDSEKKTYRSTEEGESGGESGESASASKSDSSSGMSGMTTGKSGGQAKGPPEATGPVAHVNGNPIAAAKFNDEMKKVAKTGKFPPQLLHRFKSRLIDRLVDQKLIDDAIANSSVKVADKEVDAKLDQVRAEFDEANKKSGGKATSLKAVAKKYGISDDELRESVKRSIAIEKLLVENGLELPTDKDVKKFYDDNPDKFTRPEQVHTRHILKKVSPKAGEEAVAKAKEKITELRKKATAKDADFAKLAEKHSDGPSAKKGGDIGFIGKEQFQPEYTKAAFALQKDQISEPVKTRYGWHLIKLVERRDSKTIPFEKVEGRLAKQMKNQKIQKELKTYVKELRSSAKVEKHPDNIE